MVRTDSSAARWLASHDKRSEHTPVRLRSQFLSLLVSLWIPAVTSAERPLTTEELVLRAKPETDAGTDSIGRHNSATGSMR